jgi:hypothetical protein
MAEIKVGLAAQKSSYWDPQTGTYLTLEKPVGTVAFDPAAEVDASTQKLSKIAHALFCQYPALVLYEGQLPDETVARWKARYEAWGAPQAKARADKTNGGEMPVNAMASAKAEELNLFSDADEADKAAAAKKAEEAAALAAAEAEEAAALVAKEAEEAAALAEKEADVAKATGRSKTK